jgi:hypothetical protein
MFQSKIASFNKSIFFVKNPENISNLHYKNLHKSLLVSKKYKFDLLYPTVTQGINLQQGITQFIQVRNHSVELKISLRIVVTKQINQVSTISQMKSYC